jgi:hypothetical protein
VLALSLSLLAMLAFAPGAQRGPDEEGRAAALQTNGLTLEKAIKAAEAVGGGQAVFANVHLPKRGGFAVNVRCFVGGAVVRVEVDKDGKATKKKGPGRKSDNDNEDQFPKIAAEFTAEKVTLGELASAAEKHAKGTAFNAWGYLDDDKVFVRVLVATKAKNDKGVEEHTTVQVVMDPRTKKPKD